MATMQTNLTCDLQNGSVKVKYLGGVLFSQDNQANQINVAVYDGGEPATISGTVTANIIRADGGTVAATGGSISGNVASITLPAAAYAIPGVASIIVKLSTSGVVTTLAAFVTNIYESSTSTAIDPGTIIPSVTALVAQIDTAVASIPADYSALWTTLAPAFSTSTTYAAGQYVTYNGGLYRFTAAHTGNWSASDVVAANIGNDISSLKNAIDGINTDVYHVVNMTGQKSYPYKIKSGEAFVATNNADSQVSIRLRTTIYGDNLQTVIVNAGKTVEFTANFDAEYLNPYTNGTYVDAVVSKKNTTYQIAKEAQKNSADNTEIIGALDKSIKYQVLVNGGYNIPFVIKNGETYIATNNGDARIALRLRGQDGSTNLQTVYVNPDTSVEFVATTDAIYINPYSTGTYNTLVEKKGTINNRVSTIEKEIINFVDLPVETDDISGNISENEYQIPSGLSANYTEWLNLWDVGTNLRKGPVEFLLSGGSNDTSGFTYAYVTTYDENLASRLIKVDKDKPIVLEQTFGTSRPYIRFYYTDLAKDENDLTIGGTFKITCSNLPAITTEKIMPLAITSDKIANMAVTADKLSDMIPDYWRNHIVSKCQAIANRMAEIGKHGETFVFITDIHWYQNEQKSPHLIRYILNHTNVNMVICGGDLITQGQKQYEINESLECVKAYDYGHIFMPIAFGNHDNNSNQTTLEGRIFDTNTVYSLFMKPFENEVKFLTDTEFSFWFDKEVNKTRYIILDTGDDGTTRYFTAYDEFYNTLMSVPDGYNVVVIAHIVDYGFFPSSIANMIDAYNKRLTTTVQSKNYDFSNATGSVFICIGGHRHIDKELSTPDGVCITVSDCDAMRSHNEETPQKRLSITEQSFEVVTLDYEHNTAYYEKIGRGRNRIFHCGVTSERTLVPSINGTITWSSSDTSIATVANGVVTKITDGRAIIKADSNQLVSEIWIV